MEVLKQGQYEPLPVERQVIIIFAATHGHLDKYPINSLQKYEKGLNEFLNSKYPDIPKEIITAGKIDDTLKARMEKALQEFEVVFGS